jgi:hypothetical protein
MSKNWMESTAMDESTSDEQVSVGSMELPKTARVVFELKAENDRLRTELFRQDENTNKIVFELKAELEKTNSFLQAVANTCKEAEKENESLREQLGEKECGMKLIIEQMRTIDQMREQLRTARAEERGRCAKECEGIAEYWKNESPRRSFGASICAREIRALGDAEPQHPPHVTPEETAKLKEMQDVINNIEVNMDTLFKRFGFESQNGEGGMSKLPASIIAFDQFLNEPPQYEELRTVRDYRHSAYIEWEKASKDLRAMTEAIKKSEEALEGIIVEGVISDGFPLMKSLIEDARKAIEDVGKE